MAKVLSALAARQALRAVLAGSVSVRTASVHDPLTARIAARLGFPVGMLGGSVAALVVLGAPDHALLSLDELAGLCRRISRAGALPLLVDADHGFGNALHAMRCVAELEAAGVAGLTVEDTCLPQAYGATGAALISLAEARKKLTAAVAGRQDPALVIVARTDARLQDADSLIARAQAYGATGADAMFITGARDPAVVARAQSAAGLPLIIPAPQGDMAKVDLTALGVRICLTPHRTLPAATAAAWDSLAATPGAASVARPADLMAELSDATHYDALIARYLQN
jgi:carboxyvinyl-carboxyphosphonate phosphorylmutase